MKFLSLFTKAPQHQRFNYKPRFYDPQKEEMQQREERIKIEVARVKGEEPQEAGNYRSRIAGSFHAARRRSQGGSGLNPTLVRLGILLFLAILLISFLQWGRPALYALFLFIPVYFYLKFKSK